MWERCKGWRGRSSSCLNRFLTSTFFPTPAWQCNHKPKKTHHLFFCINLKNNSRARQLERRQVCTSLDLSTRPNLPSAASARWLPDPPAEEVPPPRPPSSPTAAGPAPYPHYLPPLQTSRRHSSWCGRVAPWNLLKMAVFDSAPGRPTPDHPLLQTGFSEKPQLEASIKNRHWKKHICQLSSPESIKPAKQQIPIDNNSSFC